MLRNMVDHFFHKMFTEFEMIMVGEFTYFLGFQVNQMEDGIYFFQSKYDKIIVNKFDLENACHKCTYVATHVKLSKDEQRVFIH